MVDGFFSFFFFFFFSCFALAVFSHHERQLGRQKTRISWWERQLGRKEKEKKSKNSLTLCRPWRRICRRARRLGRAPEGRACCCLFFLCFILITFCSYLFCTFLRVFACPYMTNVIQQYFVRGYPRTQCYARHVESSCLPTGENSRFCPRLYVLTWHLPHVILASHMTTRVTS